MNTAQRAAALAEAAQAFPFLGRIAAADLIDLVRLELGHAGALDDFQLHDGRWSKASAPGKILHIISGNTPSAGLQSLMRGLLLGAGNLCKIPSAGLPEIAAFQQALPETLARRVQISAELSDEWLRAADAVIVFGSDESIAHFHQQVRPEQIFVAHGHRLSFAIVYEDPEFASVSGAAKDVSVFDQQGCLSPQVIFVAHEPRAYAARLAEAMQRHNELHPRAPLTVAEAGAIRNLREELAFGAANGEPVAVWESAGSTEWTVVFEERPRLPRSPLNRVIFVLPLPGDLAATSEPVRPHLSTIGIWPATRENALAAAQLGGSRICPLGEMQSPPLTWRQDGQEVLTPLVRWIDLQISQSAEAGESRPAASVRD